ncbi:MAG: putative ribonuclease [Deltaproteobacteria bacterium]|nr:putative ribonuclease [Deltaproteobacteria bacterium]
MPKKDLKIISKVIHFFTSDIFSLRIKDLRPFQAFLVRHLRIFVLAIHGFIKDGCSLRASALTYYSLLSIVPVFAMAFGIAKGFGLENFIQKEIIGIAETANWPAEIVDRILSFSHSLLGQAKGGLMAGVGFILLCWTAISILSRIEESFNHIWDVKKARTIVRKVTDYISIVVFTPVLMIIAGSASVLVGSKIQAIMGRIELLGPISGLILVALKFLPYVSIWAMLTLNYIIIPNRRVPFGPALFAGIVTGTIYQLVQYVYIKFQIGVVSYGAIYGSFAVLPLFVVWLQLSWMIVLLGAEIAVAKENQEVYGFHPDFSRLSVAARKALTIEVFHLLVKRFANGEPPLTPSQISKEAQIPKRLVLLLLGDLVATGFVVETAKEVRHEPTYQPGKTIEGLRIHEVVGAYERVGAEPLSRKIAGDDKVNTYLRDLEEAMSKIPQNVTIKDI